MSKKCDPSAPQCGQRKEGLPTTIAPRPRAGRIWDPQTSHSSTWASGEGEGGGRRAAPGAAAAGANRPWDAESTPRERKRDQLFVKP
jgi:hypothetical protein